MPSLSIAESPATGAVLLNCHAGCEIEVILSTLDLWLRDLFETLDQSRGSGTREIGATYDYVDETGELLLQVVRFAPKDFRQRRPDGGGGWHWNLEDTRRVLYRLPEVIGAVKAGQHVFIVEGEKDVETLRRRGLVATCNSGGAGSWRKEYDSYLYDGWIVVISDNDDAGRKHSASIGRTDLRARTSSFTILELADLPEHGDVTEWLNRGHTVEELKELVSETEQAAESGQGDADKDGDQQAGDAQRVKRLAIRWMRDAFA